MIARDKPLKPALLIFARLYEQIQELTSYINNRLLRFPNQEDELYGALDGAAYVASIELRKVYQHELNGVTEIRPTPQARARIEASQGLLNDSFQQTLIGCPSALPVNEAPTFFRFFGKTRLIIICAAIVALLVRQERSKKSKLSLEDLTAKLTKCVRRVGFI